MSDIVEDLKMYVGGDLAERAEAEIQQLRADKQELVEALDDVAECLDIKGDADPYAYAKALVKKHGGDQ